MKVGSAAAAHHTQVSGNPFWVSSPRVSVVLVSYNQSRYLRAAVDSVMRQTFNNYEVIIVDDGSQDGSIGIIRDLVAQHPATLQFYHHPDHRNLGILKTYALGISMARGPYVAFIEGDDSWEENYLERKVHFLDRFPEVGVVFSPYRVVSNGLCGWDMALRQRILGLFMPRNSPFDNFKNLMKKNNVATFSAFMMRRSLLDRVSLSLPEDILYFDWWILFQLGMHAKFIVDKTSCIRWRHHSASTLRRQNLDQHRAMLCRFMGRMYEAIGLKMDQMTEQNRIQYLKNRSVLPQYISFYQQPGAGSFLAFLRVAPVWALDSLASCCVNYWKYSRGG